MLKKRFDKTEKLSCDMKLTSSLGMENNAVWSLELLVTMSWNCGFNLYHVEIHVDLSIVWPWSVYYVKDELGDSLKLLYVQTNKEILNYSQA